MTTKHELHESTRIDPVCPFIIHPWSNCSTVISNWHSNIEIICVVKGEISLKYDEEVMRMTEGELSVISSNVLHGINTDESNEYHCIIIDDRFCKDNGIDTDDVFFEKRFSCPATYDLCQSVAKRYSDCERQRTPITVAKLRSSVLSLLIDVYENHRCPSSPKDNTNNNTSEQYVKNVISHLSDSYREKITLDALAKMCGVSKCHLSREFKKYTGQTIMTYLNLLRCKKAQSLIKEGYSITSAAMSVGFDDLSYFSKTYKSLIGISPTQERNK